MWRCAAAATGEDGALLPPAEHRGAVEEQVGAPRGAQGQWASCIRIVDPATLQVPATAVVACPLLLMCS